MGRHERYRIPINATANGIISLKDLIALIEEKTNKRAKISLLGTDEIRSPYAIPASWYMNNERATKKVLPLVIWRIGCQA